MQVAQKKLRFPKEEDRRGTYDTVTWGLSFGGGQKVQIFTHFNADADAINRNLAF
jgi:hypothetical protein